MTGGLPDLTSAQVALYDVVCALAPDGKGVDAVLAGFLLSEPLADVTAVRRALTVTAQCMGLAGWDGCVFPGCVKYPEGCPLSVKVDS